jgi:hypothetical protein
MIQPRVSWATLSWCDTYVWTPCVSLTYLYIAAEPVARNVSHGVQRVIQQYGRPVDPISQRVSSIGTMKEVFAEHLSLKSKLISDEMSKPITIDNNEHSSSKLHPPVKSETDT